MKIFVDLFSGIGGFALGAYWAGMRFDKHYFSEVDPYAIAVYQKRFPDAEPLGDITKIDGHSMPKGEYIIAGGFPCQDISCAGKGLGLEGARSGLWYEYARLIGELRPRYTVMENVGQLLTRGMGEVLGSLSQIGYDAEWQDIRASDLGAAHKRERIWIVAYPSEVGLYTASIPDNEVNTPCQGPWGHETPHVLLPSQWDGVERDCRPLYKSDGISEWVGEIAALGNSIVPEISEMIFRQIKELTK